jgi:rhomboid-like protein
LCQLRGQFQTRAQHNQPSKTPSNEFLRQRQNRQSQNRQRQDLTEDAVEAPRSPAKDGEYSQSPESVDEVLQQLPKVKVRYLRPAIWALLVSSGIYVSLAYLEAKDELKKSTTAGGWLQAPQWNTPKRTPPGPIEVATGFWETLNPISRLSYGIIGVNSVIHLSSFVMPAFHQSLWHMPARNVNYTQFTSMFVHGGALHLCK